MSDMSSGIVVVTEFCSADDGAFSSYIDYMDRDEATRKKYMHEYSLFEGYMDYMGDTEKTSSLFTKSIDSLSSDQVGNMKALFKTAQSNGSNMWQTVISFDNDFLELMGVYDKEHGLLDEKRLRAIARKSIGQMLDNENLNNAVWTAAFHYNTDNIHVHVATVEPNPQRESKLYIQYEKEKVDGKMKYKLRKNEITGKNEKIPLLDKNGKPIRRREYRGKFKQSSIEICKSELRKELDIDKSVSREINDIIRGRIVGSKKTMELINDKEFRDGFVDLYDSLPKSVSRNLWNYKNPIMQPYKAQIDDLSTRYIAKYHSEDFARLESQLERQERVYKMAYGGANDYKNKKLEDLYYRLGNAILQEIKAYDKNIREAKETAYATKKQLIFYNKYMSVSNKNHEVNSTVLRMALRYLKRSMDRGYERWKNEREYEKLQREISKSNNREQEME